MANTVSVEKVGNEIFFQTAPVFQYNVGSQYLQLTGFDLPAQYRVDFSNYIDSQDSVSVIGDENGAVIPNNLLATGSTVYAFYVDVDADSTQTLYRIEIPVIRRPEPSDREPSPEEQSAISQLMNEIGDLSDLETTDKSNLVAAINEAASSGGGGGGSVTVDSALSTTSTNPVQNKVITSALNNKADSSSLATVATSGSYNDLSNKPTIDSAPTINSGNAVASNGVYRALQSAVTGMQTTANLVTSVSSASTDSQYPSAKLLYDTVGNIETLLAAI